MIEITEKAAEEIKKIVKESDNNVEDIYLRVGIRGGGCSGYSYILDVTNKYSEDKDLLFDKFGIKVVCDDKSYLYLKGTEIDFKDTLMQSGFTFNNPNHTTCGCGSSFNV